MSLWLNTAGKLVWNGTAIIDCDVCPCPGDGHSSPCNSLDLVPSSLRLTLNYEGNTFHVDMVWTAVACVGGTEGWAYDGPPVEFCTGFTLDEVSLCCETSTWSLELAVTNDGIPDAIQSGGTLDELTILSTNPVYYTASTGGEYFAPSCSGFDFITVDIQPTP